MKVTTFQMGAPPQPNCPACNTPGYNVNGPWFRCPMCGMGFMKPEDLQKRIEELKQINLVETAGARAPYLPEERIHKITVLHQILMGFNAWNGRGDIIQTPKPVRGFEIGFGNAAMMEGAQQVGWEVEGCEAAKSPIEYAEKIGLKVRYFQFDNPTLEGIWEPFDLVWAWDTMEHMVDIKQAFRNAQNILKLGGIFVLHSPDFDKYYFDQNHSHFKDPSHLWHMTPAAMEGLKSEDFQLLRTERGSVWGSQGHAHPDNFVAWFRRKS